MTATKKLTTWTMCDRGYDCDKFGDYFDCTAETFIKAVRMLFNDDRIVLCNPINDVRGCSTFAAYVRCPTGGHSKIGCGYIKSERPAE
jgi:hypothetical protein